ncbi:hypothetical protein, partial [Bartonella sp. TT67HLJMS]|uniref:hypothetical protein n=1 Tax=Bartonella sp. TT67HLJMS TaxID=3243582 RepID=UPI0035CF97B4
DRHKNIESLIRGLGRDDEERAVTIAAASPLKKINVMNSEKEARVIFNLAAGSIVKDSTEAVNGSQIYKVNESLVKLFGGSFTVSKETGKFSPTEMLSGYYGSGQLVLNDMPDLFSVHTRTNASFGNVARDFNHTLKALGGGAGFDPKIGVDKDA